MWLHRKSGLVENLEDETQIQVTGFSTGGDTYVNMTGTFLGMSVNPANIYYFFVSYNFKRYRPIRNYNKERR